MAVGVLINFVGGTLEQYDDVVVGLGMLPGGPAVPQEIFHWVAETENGFRVVDVWESKEAFERFAEDKVFPLLHQVGIELPPEIEFFEIHNYLAGGQWRR